MEGPGVQQLLDQATRHHQSGRLREAEMLYRQALSRQPDNAEALHLLGVLAGQVGRADAAQELIRRAIAINPRDSEMHFNLGVNLSAAGKFDEAIASYRQAIGLQEDFAEAHSNLGHALRSKGALDEATGAYRKALALAPRLPQSHLNLAVALHQNGKLAEAIAEYHAALALHPNSPEILNNLGNCLLAIGDLAGAIDCLRQALALRPAYAEAHNNLGNALKESGQFDQAILSYRQAITLSPASASFHNNLGLAFREMGALDQTIASHQQALRLEPDNADAHYALAWVLLLRGEFAQGWREFEWRRRRPTWQIQTQPFEQPHWEGQDLTGRRILLHAEQGLGDAIQFVRYAPVVARRGARVFLQCHAELGKLFADLPGIDGLTTRGDPLPPVDFLCPLMSLPGIFGTALATIPTEVPYIRSDPANTERWRARLAADPSRLKIGLVWAGRPGYSNDRRRSISLKTLASLATVDGTQYYSLQKGPAAAQLADEPFGSRVIDLSADLEDFADTAAALENVDLVISVDTAVAHLAGAMGRPIWLLLPFAPDWRWLLGRDDSPWYPTMRLFRQPRPGDWDSAVRKMVEELSIWRR